MTPGEAAAPALAPAAGPGPSWFHTIELADGTVTPGLFDNRRAAGLLRWPAQLPGGRCLDVGTCDGFWAFEMERRGAGEVVAIDVDDRSALDRWPRPHGPRAPETSDSSRARAAHRFELVRQSLGSQVTRLGCSVYDLDPDVHGRFDVVFCGTLLMHLRDPVAALGRMRSVCAGELVLVEGLDATLDLLARGVPCARFAPAPDQWWRVNAAGLRALLEVAGFEPVWTSRRFLTPFGPGAVSRRRSGLGARARAAALRLLRTGSTVPGLAHAAGLALGTYDVALRARPR